MPIGKRILNPATFTQMLHHCADALHPLLGYTIAGVSAVTCFMASAVDSISPDARGWMELGGTLGLIGGLSYGCVTLWKALQEQRKESAAAVERSEARAAEERKAFIAAKDALELEIRTDWKQQNAKLIEVLNRLDPDT